ncbi:hypothetical protein LZ24_02784 [Desulfobotulus alkaliphilus]|uniref:Alpha-2-macroglobulin family protein n=1 Tax=Desulfobotulus alkaliphilus TaxID=622671 RepID=A0A562RCZ7_9BACT|nr:MG2 domain-containing protein [Desulfobotulus alkaliphilus]TWI66949.1 hypothetical protein LZ24_02784 [Desulfobotulus alkaliphilus]
MHTRIPAFFFCLFHLFSSLALASPLIRIVPQGEDVPSDQRIRLEFDRPMIPLGQAAAENIPVRISPEVKGQWRWTDPQTLSFRPDPEEKLKPATRYRVDVDAGLVSLDGRPVPPVKEKTFVTTRPEIRHGFFLQWIDEVTPVFELQANLPLTRTSVEKAVVFHAGGVFHPVKVSAAGDLPDAAIATSWIIQPARPLPANEKTELMVKKGLRTPEGDMPGMEIRNLRNFVTFPAPAFLGIRYTSLNGENIFIPASSAGQTDEDILPKPADPQGYTELLFSTPVRISQATQNITFTPPLPGINKPWEDYYDYDPTRSLHTEDSTYSLSLPATPLPLQEYTIHVNETMSDAFSRKMGEARMARFHTDRLKPSFYLPTSTAVLEKGVASELPISFTNIKNYRIQGSAMDKGGFYPVDTGYLQTGIPENTPTTLAAGVRNILTASGILSAEVQTDPEVSTWEGASRFLAIVSPWQVVAKIGHFNSLIWVTDLRTGQPVSGVTIRLLEGHEKNLEISDEEIATTRTNGEGIALLPGTAELDPEQKTAGRGEYREDKPLWFLEAASEKDLVLFPLDWRFALNPWQISDTPIFSSAKAPLGHLRSWGLTAQGIYRTGETMEYKIYVRNQDLHGLIPPPLSGWTLRILDPSSQEIFKKEDFPLSAFGTFHGALTIPENGRVGRYSFELSHKDTDKILRPLSVMVTDFSTAPFRVQADIAALQARPGDEVTFKAGASLHAGGAYTEAPVRIRSHIRSRPFTPDSPALKDFYFDSNNGRENIPVKTLADLSRRLDDKGRSKARIKIPETDLAFGTLSLEAGVSDERGKTVSASTSIPFEGRDMLVGIKALSWMQQSGKSAEFRVVVVDPKGKIIPDIPIRFVAERQDVSVVRARSAGDAYTPRHSIEWKEIATGSLISGESPKDAVFTPDTPGRWRVRVEIKDSRGRSHQTRIPVWVSGSGPVIWESPEDLRVDLVPEKTELQVGDTARILVKNPFPGAKALISVERYGVLRHEVRTLENGAELIEIPMGPAMLPGCYVSVSILSPRVEGSLPPEEGPDLGKPAFRSGYLYLSVKPEEQKIPVRVDMDRESYKPGETVHVSIEVPEKLAGDTELALAVLDSAIFDLLPGGKKNFDPHTGLYAPVSSMDLETYTLLSRLIGMQRLEAKGATPAGDGGGIRLREDFRGVAFWQPEILPDASGRASVSFSAPDNLTSWEVLVLAVTPKDRMGTGHGLFRVNRPTEIRPVMPNFLRTGDRLEAGFSIFNRTDQARDINIRAELHKNGIVLSHREFEKSFEPWQRQLFLLPVKALNRGSLRMEVIAKDALDGDAMVHTLKVKDSIVLETQTSSGMAGEQKTRIPVRVPEKARNDLGVLGIRLSPSLISSVEAPLLFLRDYPYDCWEQQLSKAMGAALYLSMMDYLPDEVQWQDAEKIIPDILAKASLFQRDNGSMAYFPTSGGGENPMLSAFTALIFKKLADFGFYPDPDVSRKLDAYLDTLMRRDISGNPVLDRSSRIMALLARTDTSDTDLFERLRPHPGKDGLFATALFLEAAARKGLDYDELSFLVDALLARTHKTAGGLAAQDEKSMAHPWLMGSHSRTQAAVLMAMVRLGELPDAPEELRSYPPLLMGELMAQQGPAARWQGTQENLFGAMAATEYALSYESDRVDLVAKVRDDAGLEGNIRFRDIRDTAVRMTRPMGKDDPGRDQILHIEKKGTGSLYYTAALAFAWEEPQPPADNGLHVRLRILNEKGEEIQRDSGLSLARGDRVHVVCDVSNTQRLHFIMAEIPLPAGLEAVNPLLKGSEEQEKAPALPDSVKPGSPWPFYHQELQHQQVRFFAEDLPAGTWRLHFTAQAIAEGSFLMPAAHAEALYRSEIWGRDKEHSLHIGPRPDASATGQ